VEITWASTRDHHQVRADAIAVGLRLSVLASRAAQQGKRRGVGLGPAPVTL